MLESPFNKVAGLKACSFIKMRLQHKCFPVNTAKFLRTAILKKIRERRQLDDVIGLKYNLKKISIFLKTICDLHHITDYCKIHLDKS